MTKKLKFANLLFSALLLSSWPAAAEEQNHVSCIGFLTREAVEPELLIVGARQERYRQRFGQGDIVRLNVGSQGGIKTGDELVILRRMGKVRLSDNSLEPPALYIAEVGRLRVIDAAGSSAEAEITHSCDTVLIGDFLLPPGQRLLAGADGNLRAVARRQGVSGKIVLARNDQRLIGQGDIVYVNLGRSSGIAAGDRLLVYRDHDGFGPGGLAEDSKADTLYSYNGLSAKATKQRTARPRIIGELLVLRVSQDAATARVDKSSEEMLVGDRVVLR